MRRTIWLVAVILFIFVLAGCSKSQVQTTIPKIDFDEKQCPYLKTAENDEIINIINTEIAVHFQQFTANGNNGDTVRSVVSSADTIVSILLKTESDLGYGTDGEIWGICYDYGKKTLIPCGTYLSWLHYSYADICKNVKTMLSEDSLYEYINIPYYYFDSDSNPVLVVIAIEHPVGADAWKRIYFYSPVSNSFIDFPQTA